MSLPIEILNKDDYSEICSTINRLAAGNKIVFTNGCFDILHLGHLETLRYARSIAGTDGFLVVGINDDASIARLKGPGRPILDENTRAIILATLRLVDFVIVFEEDTPRNLIESLRPQFIIKGGDYKVSEVVGNDISSVLIVPTLEGASTTNILQKIRKQ